MGDYALSYDTTRIFLNQVFSEKKSTLYFVVGVAAFFTFPFSICACVVASTPNAGFNVILTAIFNLLYIGGAVHVISSSKTPIAIGYLLGASTGMSILNLLTAIYWGQLSKCTSFDQDLKQYACSLSQPDAYGAVCAFAVLLFLTQIVFTYMLYIWRGALIDDVDVIYNDSYSSLPQTGAPTSNNYGNKFAPVQTAEL